MCNGVDTRRDKTDDWDIKIIINEKMDLNKLIFQHDKYTFNKTYVCLRLVQNMWKYYTIHHTHSPCSVYILTLFFIKFNSLNVFVLLKHVFCKIYLFLSQARFQWAASYNEKFSTCLRFIQLLQCSWFRCKIQYTVNFAHKEPSYKELPGIRNWFSFPNFYQGTS